MHVLQRVLKLLIDDLEQDPDRWASVRLYDGLLSDYMANRGHQGVPHTAGRYLSFM